MISVNLNDIINASDTFSTIMQQSFKGSLAFKIARLARELNKEMETFNDARRKILEKYCELDENGQLIVSEDGNVKVKPNETANLNNEFNALVSTEVEINADKLPMSAIDEFDITPQQMLNLEKFFEE